MSARFSDEEFARLKDLLPMYDWSMQIALTKFKILQQDHIIVHNRNPIEHTKARIKSPLAIAHKLQKLNLEITADSAKKNLRDISGIRMICPFAKDIYYLVDIIKLIPGFTVVEEEDYIANPKPSGYRSFHLIVHVPVYHSGTTDEVPVEIQLRTAAMDFWATIEHQVRYKYKEHIPQHLSDELVICADKIAELDKRMLQIHEIIALTTLEEST